MRLPLLRQWCALFSQLPEASGARPPGVPLYSSGVQVVLVRPGALPKTSSGKLQRSACRARYLDGTLQRLTREPA